MLLYLCSYKLDGSVTAIMFSSNTRDVYVWCVEVKSVLRIEKETMNNDHYLGLSVHIGSGQAATFTYLKERMWLCSRMEGENVV